MRTIKQRGFNVIQITLTMAFITFVAIQAAPVIATYERNRAIATTRLSMETLAQASVAYRSNESAVYYGSWPTYEQLAGEGYGIATTEAVNPRGHRYSLSFDRNSSVAPLRISTTLADEGEGRDLAAQWGVAGILSGNTVTLIVPVPGLESAHDELLPRNGSRSMTGTLNLGNNDVTRAGSISAVSVDATGDVDVLGTVNSTEISYH